MIKRIVLLIAAAALLLAACSAPQSTPMGRLVFEREVDGNADIFVMNADGTGLTQLTDEPGWDGTPAWSPDGNKIAFASERLGLPAIFIMDADGSNVQQLTSGTGIAFMPAWSPDGSTIAFASTRTYQEVLPGGRQEVDAGLELWIMDPDGSSAERITGNTNDQSLYPSWSPDGTRLAFMEIDQDVRILSKEPARDATATILSDGLRGRHWTPAWSPNGDLIAIMTEVDGRNDIWLIRPEGGEAANISNQPSNEGDPAWSPDGRHIAFISDRDGPVSLYVMDADGQNVRRLTDDDATYARPSWTTGR